MVECATVCVKSEAILDLAINMKIAFESQNFGQLLLQDLKKIKGLVIGFGPKGRSGRMCDSVR